MKHDRDPRLFKKSGKKIEGRNKVWTFWQRLALRGPAWELKSINNSLLKPAPPSFLRGHITFSLSSRHSSPSSSIWFIPERCGVRGNGNQHFSPHSSSRVFPLPAGAAGAAAAASTASPAAFSKPLPQNLRIHPAQLLALFLSCFLGEKKNNPY